MEETKTQDDAGGAKVVKLLPHDDRSATPLQNPMKKHAIPQRCHVAAFVQLTRRPHCVGAHALELRHFSMRCQ